MEMNEDNSKELKEASSSDTDSSPSFEISKTNLTMPLSSIFGRSDIDKNNEVNLCCSDMHIPSDLISEVFVRLPVKSICRFRCLSKIVLEITTERGFLKRNRQSMPLLLEVVTEDILSVFAIDENGIATLLKSLLFDEPKLREVRHCHGLIGYYSDGMQLRLCNVTTEDIIELPAVHSNLNYQHFELGFDPLSKKYKVLVWLEDEIANYLVSEIFICTLEKSNIWRRLRVTPLVRFLSRRPQVCSEKGTLFWLFSGEQKIVSLNLAHESFRTVLLPEKVPEELPGTSHRDFSYSLLDFEGRLCLAKQKLSGLPLYHMVTLNLWILKDFKTSCWEVMVKDTRFPLEGICLRRMGEPNCNPQYADFSERNGEVLIAASDESNEYIFVYSILSQSFRRLQIRGIGCRNISLKHHEVNSLTLKEFGSVVEPSLLPGFKRISLRNPSP